MTEWKKKAQTELAGIKFSLDYPMAALTTFKIGGPADLLVEPSNVEELQKVLQFCHREQLPWMVLGLGSNLLVRDRGIRGIVIKLRGEFTQWNVDGTRVTAGAAVTLSELSRAMIQLGLSGLEFACGIPGSVGGAVYMNAGAYDGMVSTVLTKAEAFDPQTGSIWYDRSELDFGYRHSRFQQSREVIIKVIFDLKPALSEEVAAKVNLLTQKRECRQPLELPSAGSVFRRPEGHYVGPMIEAAGLKGFQIGGARVSEKHAGFIVNVGQASAQDVLDLIEHIRAVVKANNDVDLIPEIKVVGEP